jgi:hypothetical protein
MTLQNPGADEVMRDHFDFNPIMVYSDVGSNSAAKPFSKEVYDRICKVLNFRKVILALWNEVQSDSAQKGSTTATLVGDAENLSKDSENNISNMGLTPIEDRKSILKKPGSGPRHFTFDFDDVPVLDRRSRAGSEDSVEELKVLRSHITDQKELKEESKPNPNSPTVSQDSSNGSQRFELA